MKPVGRLALREQDGWWIGYIAPTDSMHKAVELGRIRINIVTTSPRVKEQFIDLMMRSFDVICQEVTGQTPEWPTEDER